MIKVDFEAAVISAINKAFPDSVMAGCNLNYNSSCEDKYKIFVLMVEHKENDQVRLTFRLCAALAYLLITKVERCLAYDNGKCSIE